MSTDELYEAVVRNLSVKNLLPLHKAIMEECCENALSSPQNITNEDTLVFAVQVSFLTAHSLLKGTIEASLKLAQADQVTLNYRNQTFTILKTSPFLK